jgi:hypothetical protein
MRRLLIGIRTQIDAFVVLIEGELRERGALHERTISDRNFQQPQ